MARLKEKIGDDGGRGRLSSVHTNHRTDAYKTNTTHRSHISPSLQERDVPAEMIGEVRLPSYVLIDFDTTKALNESAQAHAANRDKGEQVATR